MIQKSYGRLLDTEQDIAGREIKLYLNISNHIQKLHNRIELWAAHWKRIIKNITPREGSDTLFYEDRLDSNEILQIRVAKEKGEYLIKTAIFSKGVITKWIRI